MIVEILEVIVIVLIIYWNNWALPSWTLGW